MNCFTKKNIKNIYNIKNITKKKHNKFIKKVAKKELKDYGIYDYSKKMYKEIKEEVKINIHKSIKTNEYYKTL